MPKVAGTYAAVVSVKRTITAVDAESKEAAIRMMLLEIANYEDRQDFRDWVNGGMQVELVKNPS